MYILLCSHRPPLQIFPSSVFSPFPSLWLLFSVCHSHPYTRTAGRVTVKNAGNRSTNRYNAQQILVRLVLDILRPSETLLEFKHRWQNPQNQQHPQSSASGKSTLP